MTSKSNVETPTHFKCQNTHWYNPIFTIHMKCGAHHSYYSAGLLTNQKRFNFDKMFY